MRRPAAALTLVVCLLSAVAAPLAAAAQGVSKVTCYTTFDEDYFYLAAMVSKPALAGKQTAPFSDPLSDDAVAVFLQKEDGPVGARRGPHSVEMAVSVAGGAQLYRGADAIPLKGFEDFLPAPGGGREPFKYGVTRRGEIDQPGGPNTGYTVEIAIPWVELGGRPQVGDRMRFNVLAHSAAPGSPTLLSLAPGVKDVPDVQNPSLWSEIVFVESPVKTVASAPNAIVCARVFTAKPLVDGQISSGEWFTLTSFAFEAAPSGAGSVPVASGTVTARIAPKITLREAGPPVEVRAAAPRAVVPRVRQPVPHLVFALYRYDFQNDRRKELPLIPALSDDGTSLLATHPMGGPGPWMTYDRVDWQREQMVQMRQAGIDVVLPVYRGGVADKARYSQRGLTTLAGALRWLRNNGQDYPQVGLYLDTSSLVDPKRGKPNMAAPTGLATLYAAIKDFFLQIPAPFRAAVPLSDKNGGGVANVVVLSSAAALANPSAGLVDYCRSRFMADFGADLIVLGGTDFKPVAPMDGYVDETGAQGFQMDDGGWIKPASLGVGYDRTLAEPAAEKPLRSRKDGDTYRAEWKQAIAKGADWALLDGWSDYRDGCEIGPTMEFGVQYADLTRVFSRALAGTGALRAAYVSHTIPAAAVVGGAPAVSVRVMNAGSTVWSPAGYVLAYQWRAEGGAASGEPRTVPLPSAVLPGQTVSIPFQLALPAQPGRVELSVDIAQLGKKGDITALLSGLGSERLAVPVQLVAQGDPAVPAYAASLVGTDLPTTLEAGGTYTARVVLRNDGAATWKKGDGGRVSARLLRYISPINATGEKASLTVLPMADASADLPSDVAPGQEVTVNVPITFCEANARPFPSGSPTDNWTYLLRWEYAPHAGSTEGALTVPETISLSDADIGAQFTQDMTPAELPGDRRVPVKLGVRNLGPQTWRRDETRIGYHWYYLDGTEVIWQDEMTPIVRDVPPGDQVNDLLVWITAPPNDGTYWLVWDVRSGETWASTQPSVRPFETRVHQVQVVRGRLQFVDLTRAFNLDGVSTDSSAGDADFDGAGRSLPGDLVPPFAMTDTAPLGLWMPMKGVGPDASRRLSFQWGPKGDVQRNVLQCLGQRVSMGDARKMEPSRAVHLLAAATTPDAAGPFTLVFADGTQQFIQMPISPWDTGPRFAEEVAYRCRRIRGRSGDVLDKTASLYHYTIRVPEPKRVAAILLPNAPGIKILAITLEK